MQKHTHLNSQVDQEIPFASAKWIGMSNALRGRAAPMMRLQFQVPGVVKSAELNICGLGYYEGWINGCRIGDQVLDPAQTDYDIRCLYATHEVTAEIHSGLNVLGVMLGDGFFNQDLVWAKEKGRAGISYGDPRLIAELTIHLADGEVLRINTDERWRCSTGPLTASNVYAGECYDARLEMADWNKSNFDDSGWHPVIVMPTPGGRLEKQCIPPIMKIEEMRPVSIQEPVPGCFVADIGQNISGWVRLRVQGCPGIVIRLRFAEAVFASGMIDMASTGVFATHVEQTDTYICGGRGVENWEPRFTWHGFRYVEISGWPGKLTEDDITAVVVHSALQVAGSFCCSDERLNQAHQMVLWTHRSNMHGIPEDCPARERMGWLGDAHIICEYSIYNFNGLSFWKKYLDDIESSRLANGGLPIDIAPGKRGIWWGPAHPDWMAALVLIPWYIYLYYGDREVLKTHLTGMYAVLEHFEQKTVDGILAGGFGDWCDPHAGSPTHYTPEALTTTIWFIECCRIMAVVAELSGENDKAHHFSDESERSSNALRKLFFDPVRNSFGSQTADAMALHFGLVPPGKETAVVQALVKDIKKNHHGHVTVGLMGLRFLFEVLTRYNHGDLALSLLHEDSGPSLGSTIRRGATTLWEYWGEDLSDFTHSLNHPMMGGFDNWFYNTLAGIRPDPKNPGFKHFFLQPYPIQGLDWVQSHHDCPHGRISSSWEKDGDTWEWEITVPENTSASALIPGSKEIRELGPGNHKLSIVI
jgi:alpha-L-rhamnosidase